MRGKRFKTVFLDFYGTLAAGDADVVEAVCTRIVTELNLSITPHELVVAWGDRFFAAIEANNHDHFRTLYDSECDSLVETLDPVCGRIDPVPFVDQLTEYWCGPDLHDDVHQTLAQLNLPICCVSNADTDHLRSAIDRHGLKFDHVVSSQDARCYKPRPEIFHRALSAMGAEPHEVLHVGDSLHSDVEGAANAGIEALWLCRDRRIYDIRQTEHDHKISSLKELNAYVRR